MNFKSKCCGANVGTGGDGTTNYHVCSKCIKACDVVEYEESQDDFWNEIGRTYIVNFPMKSYNQISKELKEKFIITRK